jgi:hypothetical protein
MSRMEMSKSRWFFLFVAMLSTHALGQTFAGVTTWHNDIERTGRNLKETQLTPANVNSSSFGKLFSYPVEGQTYAQPLYVPNVVISGKGTHNVVYVATEHDQVYAFDADGSASQPLWQDSFIDPAHGITSVPTKQYFCLSLNPEMGITSTPVIDPATGTLYVVAATEEKGKVVQRLHALDIGSGSEKFGGPVVLQATFQGKKFDPRQIQRTALLLLNGNVYFGFASLCKTFPWHGWIFGYSASTLQQTVVFNDTPGGERGGFWQSGAGLASDGSDIFCMGGDGTFDADTGGNDYAMSALRLSPANGTLSVVDYFTPFNERQLSSKDLDLGSGGLLLLPKQTGQHPQEMIGADKTGAIFVMDRNNLGKFHARSNKVVQQVQGDKVGYDTTAAYWQESVYYSGGNDYLSMYSLTNGKMSTKPVSQAPTKFDKPGSTPSISSDGNKNGIVWAIERPNSMVPAVLHAYDATNLANELYNSSQAGNRDTAGLANKFQVPTVANGKVYVGTQVELDVYGPLGGAVGKLPRGDQPGARAELSNNSAPRP